MKLNYSIFVITLLMCQLNYAWWQPASQFNITPHAVTVTIVNPTHYWIFCQGRVVGVTQFNFWAQSWMQNWIAPGTFQQAQTYAYFPSFFINGFTDIRCRY